MMPRATPCEFCGTELVGMYGLWKCSHCGAQFDDAMFVVEKPTYLGYIERGSVKPEKVVEPDKYTPISAVMEVVNGRSGVSEERGDGGEPVAEQEPGPPHDRDGGDKRE